MIDNAWFPNTAQGIYWTSSPDTVSYYAWAVNFFNANAVLYERSAYLGLTNLVRLVR